MKFLRRDWSRYSKLGKKRKKKQVWRKPTGRDNKMREKRKGYPAVVSIGYKKKKEDKKINIVHTKKDFENIQKDAIVIFGKIGKKKKIEFSKIAKENKIKISNLNIEKFLKNIKKKEAQKKVIEKSNSKNKKSEATSKSKETKTEKSEISATSGEENKK
jgi:large subunit ribosomal protein L32e